MNFREFAAIEKTRITKSMLNKLELALCIELENNDSCLAIDSTGLTRKLAASDITPERAKELHCFVNGWLAAKGR